MLNFDINKELIKSLDIYNNKKHITIGLSQKFIFGSFNEALFAKIKKNTIKSQIYNYRNKKIIENEKGLLTELNLKYG